ncbi:MAG: hypothetical protein U9Q03_01395 [Patescibacteria group bacterium]|nr:hypothetical protein [Patescibacteria group bacterium]
MSQKGERSDSMEKRLHEALVAAGLEEGQLDLIATEPHIAKEAAAAVRDVLNRRAQREDAPRQTPGSVNSGEWETPFW